MQPYVSPKIELSNEKQEQVDLRVLPVIFRFEKKDAPVYPGQMVDVYIGSNRRQPITIAQQPIRENSEENVMYKFRLLVQRGSCLAVILAMLGGCAVGPNFVRPAPPDTDRYTRELQSEATSRGRWPSTTFYVQQYAYCRLVEAFSIYRTKRCGQ